MQEGLDACELLDADHIATKHLFVDYARLAVTGGDAAARLALARKICAELTVHAQVEEELFYPALREQLTGGELLDRAQAEHQEAKALVARIQALRGADEAMDDLVSLLARAVEIHVKEERDYLFPKARASTLDLAALGARMKERQQELQRAKA